MYIFQILTFTSYEVQVLKLQISPDDLKIKSVAVLRLAGVFIFQVLINQFTHTQYLLFGKYPLLYDRFGMDF